MEKTDVHVYVHMACPYPKDTVIKVQYSILLQLHRDEQCAFVQLFNGKQASFGSNTTAASKLLLYTKSIRLSLLVERAQ